MTNPNGITSSRLSFPRRASSNHLTLTRCLAVSALWLCALASPSHLSAQPPALPTTPYAQQTQPPPASPSAPSIPLKPGIWSITWTIQTSQTSPNHPPRIEEREACDDWNLTAMFSLLDRPPERHIPLSFGFPVEQHSPTRFTVTAFQNFPGDRSFQTRHDVTLQSPTSFSDQATRHGMPGPTHVTGQGHWIRSCSR